MPPAAEAAAADPGAMEAGTVDAGQMLAIQPSREPRPPPAEQRSQPTGRERPAQFEEMGLPPSYRQLLIVIGCLEAFVAIPVMYFGLVPLKKGQLAIRACVAAVRCSPLATLLFLYFSRLVAPATLLHVATKVDGALVSFGGLTLRMNVLLLWYLSFIMSWQEDPKDLIVETLFVAEAAQVATEVMALYCMLMKTLQQRAASGNGQQPLSYQTVIFSPAVGNSTVEYDTTCVICISALEEGDEVAKLPCGHLFHKGCIDPWLREQACCPLRCQRPSDPPRGSRAPVVVPPGGAMA